ncbi:CBS domain-containing protein [Halomicrococcus gelatinilyticus]|uniref:CBS domain-containing protein n=1 Tax=Halomicrococcus gelatinilyticus TaxID=1702103 RepID=UPI002E107EC5
MEENELMTETVSTIDIGESLRQAASRMPHHGVGSIVVTNDGSPTGLITKSDVAEAGVVTDAPFSQLPLAKVMSHPVVTVLPTETVREAVELMDDNGVKHLPVATDAELCGIVTSSDVVHHHEELLDEVEALQQNCSERLTTQAHAEIEDEASTQV